MHSRLLRSIITFALLLSVWTQAAAQSSGFDIARMDRTAEACDDFFQFTNGTWLKNTQIPASEARWGTFNMLADSNNTTLRSVLENAAKTKSKTGSDAQMIGDLYSTCMDEESIEKAGIAPLKPFLTQIDGLKTHDDVVKQIARMHSGGLPAVFGFGAGADLKSSNAVILNAGQGGLSLPNRDYYTKDDAKSVETRAKFVEYVANMFKLLGQSPEAAAAHAAKLMDIQTRLAKASMTPVEMRNPDNRYNKVSMTAAQELTPSISWTVYMAERGVTPEKEINLSQPGFFKEVNAMLGSVPVEDWKTYFRFMAVNAAAPALPKAFADENFNFFRKYLSGQKERQPRWKTCVQAVDSHLGEALGMEYAKTNFTPVAKTRMNEMIDNLMVSMKERIDGLKWMGADTKKEAHSKLSTFKRKIGYPDMLRGCKGLTMDRDSYAGNVLRSGRFQTKRNFEDLGKPRDKSRWNFSPPTVNASYNSVNNDITFPAGIL